MLGRYLWVPTQDYGHRRQQLYRYRDSNDYRTYRTFLSSTQVNVNCNGGSQGGS